MKVSEIFSSIQGESSYAGLPCTFVRLSGCNLRCGYCDTKYAYDDGVEMQRDEIRRRVKLSGIPLVEVTGGEPLYQTGTPMLITELLNDGYKLLVETNGSISIRGLDSRAVIILDMKTPASGMSAKMDLSNFGFLKPSDEIKFVICSRDDYDWAKKVVSDHKLTVICTVLFSPAYGIIDPAHLAGWIVEDRLNIRFNLQIHKYIFGSDKRGV